MKMKFHRRKNETYFSVKLPNQYRTIIVGSKPVNLLFKNTHLTFTVIKYRKLWILTKLEITVDGNEPPLPNVDETGAICLGKTIKDTSLVNLVKKAIERLWTAKFNSVEDYENNRYHLDPFEDCYSKDIEDDFNKWVEYSKKKRKFTYKPINYKPIEEYDRNYK